MLSALMCVNVQYLYGNILKAGLWIVKEYLSYGIDTFYLNEWLEYLFHH